MELMVGVVIVGILFAMILPACTRTGGFGPENIVQGTVLSKHIDHSSDGDGGSVSHYMLTTNTGTYEVNNGIMLGVWNADEIYGRIQVDHRYTFRTKGTRVVNAFLQEYPYIVEIVNEVPVENKSPGSVEK